jgi:hypothetical protein
MAAHNLGEEHKEYVATWGQYPTPTATGEVIAPTDSFMTCQLKSVGGAMAYVMEDADVYPIGTQFFITFVTDGGDVTLTQGGSLTEFNITGNNTITFDDVGESCMLIVGNNGTNNAWRVLGTDAGLSTV